jgi:predicted outer membrane protein
MTFSGLLATSALIAVPRRPALAQTAAESGTPERLTMVGYKAQTLKAGNFSKQISQLAVAKANNPKVRQFAEFEEAEQTAVAQVLTDETNPPILALDTREAEIMGQLQARSGKDFDGAYILSQIIGHQQLFNIQQAFLRDAMAGQEYEPVAVLARMVIQMHLTMLQDLKNEVAA